MFTSAPCFTLKVALLVLKVQSFICNIFRPEHLFILCLLPTSLVLLDPLKKIQNCQNKQLTTNEDVYLGEGWFCLVDITKRLTASLQLTKILKTQLTKKLN